MHESTAESLISVKRLIRVVLRCAITEILSFPEGWESSPLRGVSSDVRETLLSTHQQMVMSDNPFLRRLRKGDEIESSIASNNSVLERAVYY